MDLVRELLACLAEEGAEVTQASTKAFRFGIYGVYPESGVGNVEAIVAEYNDVTAILELLADEGVEFVGIGDRQAIDRKKEKTLRRILQPDDNYTRQLDLPI